MTGEDDAVTAADDTDVVTAALKEQSALGELPEKTDRGACRVSDGGAGIERRVALSCR